MSDDRIALPSVFWTLETGLAPIGKDNRNVRSLQTTGESGRAVSSCRRMENGSGVNRSRKRKSSTPWAEGSAFGVPFFA